jgi:gluconolactonase
MFQAPRTTMTRCLARLPDTMRNTPQASRNAQRLGRAWDSFLEGPCCDAAGRLHVLDILNGRFLQVGDGGSFAIIAEYEGMPTGLKFRADGRMVIADYQRGLVEVDPQSGEVRFILEHPSSGSFLGLNDLSFARNGDLYFTDQGASDLRCANGRVFRLNRKGQLDLLVENVPSPNGVALSRDEATLYVAVTRANSIWRVPLSPDGTIGRVGNFIQLSGGSAGPDGLAIDSLGNIAVAHCGLGTVWLFSPTGEPILRIRSSTGMFTTNVAYDSKNPDRLYITEAETGSILVADLNMARPPIEL